MDVGSNSVHLLVALVGFALVEPLRDRSELLGLGEVVDKFGSIPAEQLNTLCDVLAGYAVAARRSGAERLTLVGTDPLRRAANAREVCDAVAAATGAPLRVLGDEEEAILNFIGATRGQTPTGPLVVVDIGGGSTDVASWAPGRSMLMQSLPIGSSRLTYGTVESDPPTAGEMQRMFDAASDVVSGLTAEIASAPGDASTRAQARAVFVGGTATNVARLGPLSIEQLVADRRILGRLTVDQVVDAYGVRPRRAKQLPAGVAIVHALLNVLGMEAAEVSDASLRDGAIICASRFGDEWPSHLEELLPGNEA